MLAQQVFNGLALGMGYALIAVGYSLVFGILRLVNFSHGSIYAFGAEIAMVFIVQHEIRHCTGDSLKYVSNWCVRHHD